MHTFNGEQPHNPIFMREAGLLVNDVTNIHCGKDVFHKSHSLIIQEEEIELQIPLILDGIFSYLPTKSLTPEEINNTNNVKAIFLTPDSTSWDPYENAYEEEEEKLFITKDR